MMKFAIRHVNTATKGQQEMENTHGFTSDGNDQPEWFTVGEAMTNTVEGSTVDVYQHDAYLSEHDEQAVSKASDKPTGYRG